MNVSKSTPNPGSPHEQDRHSPSPRKCPQCGKPASAEFRPFCSKRCAQLDLGNWLNETYRIAGDEEADLDEDSPEDNA